MPLVMMVSAVVGIVIFIIIVAAGIVSFIHQVQYQLVFFLRLKKSIESKTENDHKHTGLERLFFTGINSSWDQDRVLGYFFR